MGNTTSNTSKVYQAMACDDREEELIVNTINRVAREEKIILDAQNKKTSEENDKYLLDMCGNHMKNFIEVNRYTTCDIMNHIKDQKKLFDILASLSEDNVNFNLVEIIKHIKDHKKLFDILASLSEDNINFIRSL